MAGAFQVPSSALVEELQEQVLVLAQEKQDLEEYAARVTKELRRHQQGRAPPPPWAMNMQMMSPLLFSYEERIAELEAVVDRSVSLAEQSQALTRENDNLRAELSQ